MTEKPIPMELAKKILSRRSKVALILNQLLLSCKKNINAESDPSQTSTAAGNDEQNVLKESKDNVSKNSEGEDNSKQGNARENSKGKKNKSKKRKGGKKGKK